MAKTVSGILLAERDGELVRVYCKGTFIGDTPFPLTEEAMENITGIDRHYLRKISDERWQVLSDSENL